MCGEKQSLIKVYGQGSGADCRRHVQKLNALRGEMVQAEDYLAMTSRFAIQVQECKESCWNKYLYRTDENMPEQVEQENENVYMGRNGFHTQREPPSRYAMNLFIISPLTCEASFRNPALVAPRFSR
uniref:MRN complex interacting protein n=1 Tax=Scleropages formosus TaxID=113540 RepID=A0A8C9U8A7_SCLFO